MTKNTLVKSRLIAHRGASLSHPENTIEAVNAAALAGAKWIETDVQITSDGHLVMFHDRELDRASNGTGVVYDRTFDYVRSLDAGAWHDSKFAGIKIATLEEFIEAIFANNLCLQLEMKPLAGLEEKLADRVMEVLAKVWKGENNLFVSGFNERSLAYVHKHMSHIPLGMAFEILPENIAERADECGASIVHFQNQIGLEESLAVMRKNAHLEYGIATVNDKDTALSLLNMGVDHILSDKPDLFTLEDL